MEFCVNIASVLTPSYGGNVTSDCVSFSLPHKICIAASCTCWFQMKATFACSYKMFATAYLLFLCVLVASSECLNPRDSQPRPCEAVVFMRPPLLWISAFSGRRVDVLPYVSRSYDSPVWIVPVSRVKAFASKGTSSSTSKCAGSCSLWEGRHSANGRLLGSFLNLVVWSRDQLILKSVQHSWAMFSVTRYILRDLRLS